MWVDSGKLCIDQGHLHPRDRKPVRCVRGCLTDNLYTYGGQRLCINHYYQIRRADEGVGLLLGRHGPALPSTSRPDDYVFRAIAQSVDERGWMHKLSVRE